MHLSWPYFLCISMVAATLGRPPAITYFDDNDSMNQCATRLERRITGLSGVIFSHAFYGRSSYNASRNCFMIIVAPTGYRVRLKALEFDVNGHISKCDKDTLHVFDHESTVDPKAQLLPSSLVDSTPGPIIGQFCGRMVNKTMLSTSTHNALTLWWHSNPDLPTNHRATGFKLLWSAYRETGQGSCSSSREFACGSRECIPIELACDHYADCADESDILSTSRKLANCENLDLDPITTLSGGYILLLSGGLVFSSLCFCIAVCFCCKGCQSEPASLKPVENGNGYAPPEPPQFFPPSPPKNYANKEAFTSRRPGDAPAPVSGSLYRTVRISNQYGCPLDVGQNEYTYVRNDAHGNLI